MTIALEKRSSRTAGGGTRKQKTRKATALAPDASDADIEAIVRKETASKRDNIFKKLDEYRNVIEKTIPKLSYVKICKILKQGNAVDVNRFTLSAWVRDRMPELARPNHRKPKVPQSQNIGLPTTPERASPELPTGQSSIDTPADGLLAVESNHSASNEAIDNTETPAVKNSPRVLALKDHPYSALVQRR